MTTLFTTGYVHNSFESDMKLFEWCYTSVSFRTLQILLSNTKIVEEDIKSNFSIPQQVCQGENSQKEEVPGQKKIDVLFGKDLKY